MRPGFHFDNIVDGLNADSIFLSQFTVRRMVLDVFTPYLSYLLFRQFVLAVIFSPVEFGVLAWASPFSASGAFWFGIAAMPLILLGCHQTFAGRILKIIRVRSRPEMIRIAALAVIARMADKKVVGYRAFRKNVRDTVSSSVSATIPEGAVAVIRAGGLPFPAIIGATDIHFTPKPLRISERKTRGIFSRVLFVLFDIPTAAAFELKCFAGKPMSFAGAFFALIAQAVTHGLILGKLIRGFVLLASGAAFRYAFLRHDRFSNKRLCLEPSLPFTRRMARFISGKSNRRHFARQVKDFVLSGLCAVEGRYLSNRQGWIGSPLPIFSGGL